MSRENVELLARGYAAFNEGDLAAILDLLSPEFVYRPRSELPGNRPTVGRNEFEHVLRELREVLTGIHVELEEVIDRDELMVAVTRQTSRGSSSGLPIDQRVTHVWRLEDGRATELSVYESRAEALQAAGLGA